MNTIPEQAVDERRRRRVHSDEFKANAVASCVPGMSMAAVAMANGINANLLRRWVHEAEARQDGKRPPALATPKPAARGGTAGFVPVELPAQSTAADIRIELRRGATSISVSWPTDAASQCAAWMRGLLR